MDWPADWNRHPILHVDLNTGEYWDENGVTERLNSFLSDWEKMYDSPATTTSPSIRFGNVIKAAYEKTGKKVVILIDEYDKPMLNVIDDEPLADRFREILKAFYGNLKSMDRYIEFAMLTGVARFSKVSIFSDLNNLRDISFEPQFSDICGITTDELETYFGAGLDRLASANGLTRQETMDKLKICYDGYHFSRTLTDIYNPFSIVSVFASETFDNYWFKSGTPTYITKLINLRQLQVKEISGYRVKASRLSSEGIMSKDPIPALYQSGYITISDYLPRFEQYRLDYPNREVKESFLEFLLPSYSGLAESESEFVISQFVEEVTNGRVEKFMKRLSTLVAKVPYGNAPVAPEDHFQNIIYLIFTLMGFYADIENRTSNGRIDLTVETDSFVFIFEFKIDSSARAALDQILEKEYWKPYALSDKTIYLIGADFNSDQKILSDYVIEEVTGV